MDSGQSTPESKLRGIILQTPPYTPNLAKQRFIRSDSTASMQSIHPMETVSPSKRTQKQPIDDGVHVEELTEADAGYIADVDVIYPEELEEPASESEGNNSSSNEDSDISEVSDMDITEPFARLDCLDGAEAEFEKKRRAKHVRKRTNSRVFKRSHSTSVKSDTEMTDTEGMGDQDRTSSARRLRRRTRGQSGVQVVYEEALRGSPVSRKATGVNETRSPGGDHPFGETETSSTANAMDVDESE